MDEMTTKIQEESVTSSRHVVIVAPWLSKSMTGPSFYVSNLVPHLCDVGFRVTVLATDCAYAGAQAGEIVSIDARADLHIFRVSGRVNRRLYRSPAMLQWFRDHLIDVDVVDIQGIWSWLAVDIASVCKSERIPYLITPHGMMARWDWAKRPAIKRLFFHLIYRNCWKSAAAIRFMSVGERDNCMIRPYTRSAVIPPGVQLPAKASAESITKLRSTMKISPTDPIILFVGRVTAQKGVLELIEAFKLVQLRCPEAVLIIAGWLDGSYGAQVRAAAESHGSNRIRVIGPVHGQSKDCLFSTASVFATLSHNEGLPATILEALGNGIPAVVTANANVPEIGFYNAGIVVEANPSKAADAISALLLDEKRRIAMRASAQRLFADCFSWVAVLPKVLALYEEAASEQHR